MGVTSGIFRGPEGRVRAGWRLLIFFGLFSALTLVLYSVPVLGGIPGATLPVLLGAVGAGWAVLALDRRSPGALGFHLGPSLGRETLLGLASGIAVALVAIALMAASGGLQWTPDEGTPAGLLSVGGSSLWLFAIPAAAEEALFRGYPLQALADAWAPLPALLVTSVGFGVLHLGNPGVSWVGIANIVAAGLFLGALYLKTGSLWWATGAHLGWNWAHGFMADLPVSGLDLVDTPLFEVKARGPDWLGGGAFGPEGSVLALLALLAAATFVWKGRWPGPEPAAARARPLMWSAGPQRRPEA